MKIEKHDATVTNNEDDEFRGRIKVACAGLFGDEETEYPEWVEPKLDWGWFYVPDVGEIIEIEVKTESNEDESFQQTSIDALDPKWTGKRSYTNDTVDTEINVPTPVPEEFKKNYKRRGFATPAGHIFYFDDTKGEEKVHISWKQGESDYQYLTFDETGSTILANKNGTMIYMNAKEKEFTIADEHGNVISSDKKGIKIIDNFSNIIELKEGAIQILGQKAITINGGICDIKTAQVNLLDGANQGIILADLFMTMFNLHTHPTGMGPSGPVTPPGMTVAQISQNAKVGA
jgi:hypothetical protein